MGGLFFDFGAVRTESRPRCSAQASKKKEDAPAEDDGEPKMKKQSGYMYHNAQNREAAKSEIESENPDMPAKEKNQAIMKKLADMWGKLDDAAKQKWKDDAPMLPVKPKKAKKEKKEPSEKRQSTGGKVTDKKALEERMAADGWTKEEKKREGSDHVDKYWIDPKGGKKCRSIVEVARKAYPEFLSEAAKAAPTKKKPAAQKKKKPEPQAGPLAASHVGAFTSIRIVSGSGGRGWSLFDFDAPRRRARRLLPRRRGEEEGRREG